MKPLNPDALPDLVEALENAIGQLTAAGNYICGDPDHDISLMARIEAARRRCRMALAKVKRNANA